MATCYAHPGRMARWTCAVCARGLCRACRLPRRRPALCSEACALLYTQQRGKANASAPSVAVSPPEATRSPLDTPGGPPAARRELEPVESEAQARPGRSAVALPAAFYALVVLQVAGTLLLAALLVHSVTTLGTLRARLALTPAPGAQTHDAVGALESSEPGGEDASLPPGPARGVASPSLELRDGTVLRGAPVAVRGRAPYGEIVALVADDGFLAVSVVESTAFRFTDLELSPGSHTLSVVAYSREGPAVESPRVAVRYETPPLGSESEATGEGSR